MTLARRLRFSLRALLLLILAIGAALDWTLHKVREQGIAVAALEQTGVMCKLEYADGQPLTVHEQLRSWFGEGEPRELVRLSFGSRALANVDLDGQHFAPISSITDAQLVHLKSLTGLTWLSLRGTRATDATLVQLEPLEQLVLLSLAGTQVTDTGLATLERMTGLEYLFLDATRVSDAGLVHIAPLTQLSVLCLKETNVTDDGLVHLESLGHLRILYLQETQVTDAGVERLRQALPGLRIEH